MSINSLARQDWKRQQQSYRNFLEQYNVEVLRDIFKLKCPLCDVQHGNNSMCQMSYGDAGSIE